METNPFSQQQLDLLKQLKTKLPEVNSTWTPEARKIQIRMNRKRFNKK